MFVDFALGHERTFSLIHVRDGDVKNLFDDLSKMAKIARRRTDELLSCANRESNVADPRKKCFDSADDDDDRDRRLVVSAG